MADTKISALTAVSAVTTGDEFPVNDGGTSKKATIDQIVTYLQASCGMNRVKRLGSQHSVSSTTGTKVTGLDITLEAGTYTFEYALMVRSANTGDGPQFGINFSTGTATVVNFVLIFPDNSAALTAEVHIMDAVGSKSFGFISGMAHNAYSTTAPNLGTTVGVSATATNHPCWIKGIMIVTVSGNLELWEAAEGSNAATVEVGSSLVVVRTA